MNAFLQMLRGLGPMRLAAIAGVGVSILGFFIYLMSRVAAPQMELLYGDLDLADSKKTVPYGIVGGGLFLTVPINSVGDQTISSVGLNFGGGLRYYITSRMGIRFETKQLFTRIDNRADHRKELLIFQSSTLGVLFAFG